MKVLCAGFPKTGSKSCSSALRELGYNVADFKETLLYLGPVWLQYMDGKCPIEDVLAEYERHGFDANQDMPSNFCWEAMFNALSKDTKVILTVRDNEDKWFGSWCKFMTQEFTRDAIGDLCVGSIVDILAEKGFMGPAVHRMGRIIDTCGDRYLSPDFNVKSLSVKRQLYYLTREEERLKQLYRKHNLLVKTVVPADRLLVWNLKDGWEPLCNFLGKPVPQIPIPHDNKTGDTKWAEDYLFGTTIFNDAKNYFVNYIAKGIVKYGLCGFLCGETIGWYSGTTQHDKTCYHKVAPLTKQPTSK